MKQIMMLLAFSFFMGLTSCQKEGCTDTEAKNYDSTAKKDNGSCTYKMGCTDAGASNYDASAARDDGSCIYNGNVMFWTDCSTCCEVEVSVDGQVKGRTNVWYSNQPSAPNCLATGCVSVTLPVGSYSWSGRETCIGILVSGTFTITKGGCTKVLM